MNSFHAVYRFKLVGYSNINTTMWYSVHLCGDCWFSDGLVFIRKAGLDHREKADNRFSSSIPYKFRSTSEQRWVFNNPFK